MATKHKHGDRHTQKPDTLFCILFQILHEFMELAFFKQDCPQVVNCSVGQCFKLNKSWMWIIIAENAVEKYW